MLFLMAALVHAAYRETVWALHTVERIASPAFPSNEWHKDIIKAVGAGDPPPKK